MKLGKMLAVGAMALSVSFFSTACSMFESGQPEDEKDPFYVDADAEAQAKLKAEQEARAARGANLSGAEHSGPGAYGVDPASLHADAFGTRIPGVYLETVYFGFDQNRISSSEIPKVEAVADFLLRTPDAGVIIEGHCDDRGSEEYNRALGEKRALAAKEILLGRGISENRMKVISYGEERPAIMGENESAWAKNRRDEFIPVKLTR